MTVSSYLKNLSDNAIIRNQEKEAIRTSIVAIKRRLESHFDNKIKDQFIFGSYTRGTILPRSMDKYSDIDYMVVFNDGLTQQFPLSLREQLLRTVPIYDGLTQQFPLSLRAVMDRERVSLSDLTRQSSLSLGRPTEPMSISLGALTPQSYLNQLKRFVKDYYSTSQIKQSHPTIKLDLNHITFELVPALKNKLSGGYKIPTRNYAGDDWMDTNPNDFNQGLVDKNREHGSFIKPLIRLMKYWNAQNGYIYDSFELEKWIIERGFTVFSIVHTPDLKKYLFQCIEELETGHLAETKKTKVNRAKSIVSEVKELEACRFTLQAEDKIKRLLLALG